MGRIVVHIHGRPSNAKMNGLIEDYTARLKSKVRIEIHSSKLSAADYLSRLPQAAILLDEGGAVDDIDRVFESFDSWNISRDDVHLAIGPADGFPKGHGHSHQSHYLR